MAILKLSEAMLSVWRSLHRDRTELRGQSQHNQSACISLGGTRDVDEASAFHRGSWMWSCGIHRITVIRWE
jgi:hypothetical protein